MFAGYIAPWKQAPFLRLLSPLIMGIVLEWYCRIPVIWGWTVVCVALPISMISLSPLKQYQIRHINGIAITIVFLALGSLLVWYHDICNAGSWYGNNYKPGSIVTASLTEAPIVKGHSLKVVSAVTNLAFDGTRSPVTGGLILRVKIDSFPPPQYASEIIFSKKLSRLTNVANPGGFNYEQYCRFHGITHEVYLKTKEFIIFRKNRQSLLANILFRVRENILSIIRRYIKGEKEYGLAEALLIGYRDDLDKGLVQSYTNTGVVHIIAISGMHIGLIYWLLSLLCRPLKRLKYSKFFVAGIVISGLWFFSLVAGAEPSVIRSATMFTSIVIGESVSKKSSIYNNLAVSAFLLLCCNPFWLWDVGFQLSYVAVLSIVLFMRPLYGLFYMRNRILDFIWKLNAASLAAQLLTTPFSIYHFHQFPNFFLFTNFVAIPLSGVIVLGEILLCLLSPLPFLAAPSGAALSWMIWLMNSHIEKIEALPYSLCYGIQISVFQAALLILIVAGLGHWLLTRSKGGVWIGLCSLLLFACTRSISFAKSEQQKKIIVYHVPGRRAVDLVDGRSYFFIGDSDLCTGPAASLFLGPTRTLNHATSGMRRTLLIRAGNMVLFHAKKILMIDTDFLARPATVKIPIDLAVISRNPTLSFANLCTGFQIRKVVFDGSVNRAKLNYWKRDCNVLHLPYYDVTDKGAFVMYAD